MATFRLFCGRTLHHAKAHARSTHALPHTALRYASTTDHLPAKAETLSCSQLQFPMVTERMREKGHVTDADKSDHAAGNRLSLMMLRVSALV